MYGFFKYKSGWTCLIKRKKREEAIGYEKEGGRFAPIYISSCGDDERLVGATGAPTFMLFIHNLSRRHSNGYTILQQLVKQFLFIN